MLIKEATPQQIEEWKEIYNEYRDELHPNRKTGQEMVVFLQNKYSVIELCDDLWHQLVIENLMSTEHFANKLSPGKMPSAVVYQVQNKNLAKRLFDSQDEVFLGSPIIVGIELETGYFYVQGSSELWDELFTFRGLDEADLKNYYLVAEYINCLKKFGRLNEILSV